MHNSYVYNVSLFLVIKFVYLCRLLVVDSLTNVMNRIICLRNGVDTLHLLKAFPLLHFLRGNCDRYEKLVLPPADIKWTDPAVKLGTMKHTMHLETK